MTLHQPSGSKFWRRAAALLAMASVAWAAGCAEGEGEGEGREGTSAVQQPLPIDGDAECPPGYYMSPWGCDIVWGPEPGPGGGGGSCIAPACKTACGSHRTSCLSGCGGDSACRDACYDDFADCISGCCGE